MTLFARTAAVLAALASAKIGLAERIIWDGPPISFVYEGFGDTSAPENQDRITDNVWITRGSTQGLYNAKVEQFYSDTSPAGTEWAVGATADLQSLSFGTWLDVFGGSGPFGGPPFAVGADFVLHLTAKDIFLDLTLDAWGQTGNAGGSFAYTRSTTPTMGSLTGDFNEDGTVDAADYTVWRDGLGGEFEQSDYDDWRSNYGATSASPSASAVPEPGTTVLLTFLLAAAAPIARVCQQGPNRRRTL